MSDLGTHAKLARPTAQLPVSVYFDESLLQREMQQLFKAGPRYVGHELMVPNSGDYATLAAENEGRMLVRNANGIELVSNVCRHRQALMLNGRGNTNNIVCPLHRWTYDLKGELIGAPHFAETPCLNLPKTELQNWNGLLFEQNGYNVMEAPGGEEALEIARSYDGVIHLVISDVVMPNMDGPTMVRALKRIRPETAVIFMSGYAEEAFRRNDENAADLHFLPKPFGLKQLAAKVKDVLSAVPAKK